MTGIAVSNALLWVLMLGVIVALWALARQVGILYERVAPMGARPRSQMIFFLSPTCPVCKKLLPILKSASQAERAWLDVVLASDGESTQHLAFYRDAKLDQFPYVLSADLGMTYRVSRLPYAVLLDEQGIIRAKGLINNREQLESLFNAKEIGVTSVQEYLSRGSGAQSGETA